jgi:hypothetical protein
VRLAQAQREEEMKDQQFVGLNTFVPRQKTQAELREEYQQMRTQQAERFVSAIESRVQQLDEERKRAANREELARQQRFLDQARREEELAAARRAQAARQQQPRPTR